MSESRWEWFKRRGKWATKGIAALFALLLLLVVAGLVYFNRIGLPDFVKKPLLAELQARGLDVHFKRLRWHWYRGFVAEDINLGQANRPFGTQLYMDEAELRLDRNALKFFQLVPQALLAHGGRLSWHFPSPTNPSPTRYTLDNITVDLNFQAGDRWEIRTLNGSLNGSLIQLTGTLTNASHLRHWSVPRDPSSPPKPPTRLFDQLESMIRQVQFRRPPVISMVVNADAKSPSPFRLRLHFETPSVQSIWGNLSNVQISAFIFGSILTNSQAQLSWTFRTDTLTSSSISLSDCRGTGSIQFFPSPSPRLETEILLNALHVQTQWGEGRNIQLSLASAPAQQEDLIKTDLHAAVETIQSPWGKAARGHFEFHLNHPNPDLASPSTTILPNNRIDPKYGWWTRLTPAQGQGQFDFHEIESPRGSIRQISLALDTQLRSPGADAASLTLIPNLEWLSLVTAHWKLQTESLGFNNFIFPSLAINGTWQPPRLEARLLKTTLYDGSLDLEASLNAATRRVQAETRFDFNVHELRPLLATNSQRWLRQFGWQTPPSVTAQASLLLPPIDGSPIDWSRQVLPTVHLHGFLKGTNCNYRQVEADTAQTHFILSNGVWNLPDLQVTRPEGRLELEYTSEVASQDYHWVVRSHIDPKAIRPLLQEGGNKAMDLFDFPDPPYLEGHVWGRWRDLPRLGVDAHLTATNVTFRDGHWKGVTSHIAFTNSMLQARQARVWHESGTAELPALFYDLSARLITFSNCTAQLTPSAVTHAIGPQTEAAMAFYKFQQPPSVLVNGYLSVPKTTNVNMHFTVQGGPFEYWKFHLPLVNGDIYWRGDNLLLTNLNATFYRGLVRGSLTANFAPEKGSDLRFSAYVSNAELHDLMADVATRTNSLEGNLSGVLNVDYANSSDWGSWQGKGSVRLEKGIIWDIPLFGIFSPVLNSIHPGLGRSRFDQGTATYTIENSIIHTKDLQIRSPVLRLYYTGTVDFDGGVNAQAEASLLRDAPILGPLLGFVFSPLTKLFVYKVTGTLGEPRKEPLYIPKPLQMILNPVKTIRDLIPDGSNKKPSSDTKPDPPAPLH